MDTTRYAFLNALLHFLAFFMGAGIGSFLNVVIYRVPHGISVNNPKRSFCPTCKKQIPMWQNIPLFSWLMLRGKCSACSAPISSRYFFVELLTGLLFYAVFWLHHGPWPQIASWGPQVLCLWVFVALLVSGSFIDIEHFILPHGITFGGAAVGLLASLWVPQLVGVDAGDHWRGLGVSFGSAAIGLGGLWLVVELGKLAFGRKKHVFEQSVAWEVAQPDENEPPVVRFAETEMGWADIFMRGSDRMLLSCEELHVNEKQFKKTTAELWMEKLKVREGTYIHEFALEGVKLLKGRITQLVIPREAMGMGDVFFLMMIGSFCGWKCVLFTILAASVLGTVIALLSRLVGRSEWGAKIPFGPYLAAGALIWLFYGPQILEWYVSKTAWR
ncbi:MAG: prepilin peptidase [Verrucomicrobiaceae bacterium]|nr:prepilin peptidase [Verrucomicrobiaceae bacterium]